MKINNLEIDEHKLYVFYYSIKGEKWCCRDWNTGKNIIRLINDGYVIDKIWELKDEG